MENFLSKYGKHDMKILSASDKLPKESKGNTASSKKEIQWVQLLEKEFNIKLQYNDGINKQFAIVGPNKRLIKFDGYDPRTLTVYEFHGCKYHACQECKYTDTETYKKTIERERFILSKGYKLFRIWEHEFEQFKKGKTTKLGQYIN
jgi:hypothetical protein